MTQKICNIRMTSPTFEYPSNLKNQKDEDGLDSLKETGTFSNNNLERSKKLELSRKINNKSKNKSHTR